MFGSWVHLSAGKAWKLGLNHLSQKDEWKSSEAPDSSPLINMVFGKI